MTATMTPYENEICQTADSSALERQSPDKELEKVPDVPVSFHLKLLPRETSPLNDQFPEPPPNEAYAVATLAGLDMTGVLLFAAGLLWKEYQMNVVGSFGRQLANGQGTDLAIRGTEENLLRLANDLKQKKERFMLNGYRFKPQETKYRLQFSALDEPGLIFLVTERLEVLKLNKVLKLNIEWFSTNNKVTKAGAVYAALDMRLQVPNGVTEEDMKALEADLFKLTKSANAKVEKVE